MMAVNSYLVDSAFGDEQIIRHAETPAQFKDILPFL